MSLSPRTARLASWLCALSLVGSAADAQTVPEDDRLIHLGARAEGATSVVKEGDVWKLRFVGDESVEYQINMADSGIQGGLARVYEANSASWPIAYAGPGFRLANGAMATPAFLVPHCTLTLEYATADSVVLEYIDQFEGVHHRRHTYKLEGKTLRVRFESLNKAYRSFTSNYAGLWVDRSVGTDDPSLVKMQGSLATPIVRFENGAEQWFLGSMLDVTQSRAANWSLPQPSQVVETAGSIDFVHSTINGYVRNTGGTMNNVLDDTLSIVVTQKLADALVTPTTEASPYRRLFEQRTTVLLGGDNTPWAAYLAHLDQLRDWGLDNLIVYTFNWWTGPEPAPEWYPAADPASMGTFGAAMHARGVPFGAYTYFGPMEPTSPLYDPNKLAVDSNGVPKTEFGKSSMAETAVSGFVEAQVPAMVQDYSVTANFVDVGTYGTPDLSSGTDHIDQRLDSPYATSLREAILERKSWFRRMSEIVGGPLLGEGSHATQAANFEFVWAGYADSLQRNVNTGANVSSHDLPPGSPYAHQNWQVLPEYELRVFSQLQANHGNGFYNWFFGPNDGPGVWNYATGTPIFPLTTKALDRYRLYELTYGHSSYVITYGPYFPDGNSVGAGDMVLEGYLVGGLQEYYLGQGVKNIRYLYQGDWRTAEEVLALADGAMSAFVDPKLYVTFDNGLQMFLNHGAGNMTRNYDSVTYTIPEDGFLAYLPGTDVLAFSSISSLSGGQRIDYGKFPGRWEVLDGRGNVTSYGGLTGASGNVVVENYARGLVLREDANGVMKTVSENPPALVAVTLDPAAPAIERGDEIGIRATARYANGARRDVTTLVDWTTSDSSLATIDESGVLRALREGRVDVSGADFQGQSVGPIAVDIAPSLRLDVDPLWTGNQADFVVEGALPGELVVFLFNVAGVGSGSCYPSWGGLCLDLVEPVGVLMFATADAQGRASWVFDVPAGLPKINLFHQAVLKRGPGGVDSLKSNVVEQGIY